MHHIISEDGEERILRDMEDRIEISSNLICRKR